MTIQKRLLILISFSSIIFGNAYAIPENAKPNPYGGGWACNSGFKKVGDGCAKVEIPPNAKLNVYGNGWDCASGFRRVGDGCAKVEIPQNAKLNVYGNGWDNYFQTQGIGVQGDPNNNSSGGSVVNLGVYGGAALSNATGIYGTSGLFGKATNLRNASAALEVNSTTHGFLLPRMTTAQRNTVKTITGFGTITGGSGYVDGTYVAVSITGGSGQNAYARIIVSGGSVTSVALENNLGGLSGGFGYTNGASVSASNTQLGGTGAGFSVIINAATTNGMMVFDTDVQNICYYRDNVWVQVAFIAV
jgi:hypothetical protein